MSQSDPVLDSLRDALAQASDGDPHAAQSALEDLNRAHPAHLEIGLSLIQLYLDGSQIQRAIEVARTLLRHHPKSVQAWSLLARALTQLRALGDAEAALRSALAVAPDNPTVHYQMGNICFQQGQFERAVIHFEKAQAGLTDRPAVLNDLGSARLALGQVDAAVEAFREAIRVKPTFAMAHANLGAALSYRGEIHSPLQCFVEATRLAPKDHRIWLKMGRILLNQGHLETAEKCLRRVLQFQPKNGAAQAALGTVLERSGRYQEAHALLDPLVQGNIQDTTAVVAWATTCRRLGRTESAIPVLEGFLRGPRAQPERVLVGHTLGDLYDKVGQYEAAFTAHQTANQEHGLHFDPAQYHRSIDRIVAAFGPADFARRPRAQNHDSTPVLIVGMPRSGTSLVEQVIDSHSQAAGAGELETLRRLSRSLVQRAGSAHWVKAMNTLDQPLADQLSAAYIAKLRETDATALRVTDKMPTNFLNLGLAAHLVPGARVIHCVRDPMDTALSCYFKLFNFGYAFSTQLDWLGHFIRGYQRLMSHWTTVLPLPILEVRYEELVNDLEGGTRQILQFLDLEWEDSCLRFHENERPVNTASYAQVRQPIYRSSMGRSAPYEPWLEPLRSVLEK